jgi:uncharacterized membrane protein
MTLRVLTALLTLFAGTTQAATFHGLGHLPGGNFSEAAAISADGSVVVGRSGEEGFRWSSETGMESLGLSPFTAEQPNSSASGISDDHRLIIGSVRAASGGIEPAFWTEDSGWTLLDPDFQFGGGSAADVSADGTVIVGEVNPQCCGTTAFRWTESTGIELLPKLDPGGGAAAGAITPDGATVTGISTVFIGQTFIWEASIWTEASGVVGLGFDSWVTGISDNGRVIVGGRSAPNGLAFYWTEESGVVQIMNEELKGRPYTQANAVSADGSVIVGDRFYWDAENGARDLRRFMVNEVGLGPVLAGWRRLAATDVSPDGRAIVGSATNPNGDIEAWIAYLDGTENPTPSVGVSVVGTPVSTVDVSTSNELRGFTAGGVIYERDDLIPPRLTHFAGAPDENAFIAIKSDESLPTSGERAELLTDFYLDTGITQPDVGSATATLTFSTPIVNGPGPDLVIFELISRRSDDERTDPLQIAVGDEVGLVLEASWGDSVYTVDVDAYDRVAGAPGSIDELENGDFVLQAKVLDLPVAGTVIDLSDLNIAPMAGIDAVNFGSLGIAVAIDPMLFMGIDSARAVSHGDFDKSGEFDVADIDLLTTQVLSGEHLAAFDLDGNGLVDGEDRAIWIENVKETFFGDANLDGEFNSSDIVRVFVAGEYEDTIDGNSTWATGDWDGDGDFGTRDLTLAFQSAGYEQGPRRAIRAVPEPDALTTWLITSMCLGIGCRRRHYTTNRKTRSFL